MKENKARNWIFFTVISLVLFLPLSALAVTTTASPAGGLYNSAQTVTLTPSPSGDVYYTTNGSIPTTSSPILLSTETISITATTTLKFFAIDTNDNVESVKTAVYTIDITAPTGSILINNGEDAVEQTKVTLTLTCSDANGCAKMMVGNDAGFAGASEENYATSKSWTLASGDGVKTVYVKFKDGAGTGNWSVPYSDTITLDTTMPIGDPIEFLPKTGQTKCYNASGAEITCTGTGQDGDKQAGKTWPSPRFLDNGDQTITDRLTGLIWTKDAGTPTVGLCTGGNPTWQGALDYVACINTNNYLGQNDWRLPNIVELESLLDLSQSSPALPAGYPFTNIQSNYYWSSSTDADSTGYAWVVNMNYGYAYNGAKSVSYYVWPVRSGQDGSLGNSVISLSKTGQTTSYATGDDGDVEKGLAWPYPRFTDNNNGTVTDNLTGLKWLKNANCLGAKAWNDALTSANGLKSGECGLTDGSTVGDWRLPNSKELLSLVDFSKNSPSLPAGHPFTNVQSFYYWSSSTYASNAGLTLGVTMNNGVLIYGIKSSSNYVWPVRNGQSGSLGNSGILISRGAAATKDTNVNLILSASHANGVAEMTISDDASFNSAITVSYVTTKSWTLPSGDGTKTVYAKFRANGYSSWSRVYSDSIALDTALPVTTANPAGKLCPSANVTLSANKAGSTIYYTTDGVTTPTTGSPVYSSPISITSNTTLKFFAVDSLGNTESVKTETYTIDITLPAGKVVINSEAATTNNATVTLDLTATDIVGVTEMMFRNEDMKDASGNAIWSAPEAYSTSKNWKLSDGEGAKTVYVKFKDAAGNWSTSKNDTITVDFPPRGGDFLVLPKTGQTKCYNASGAEIVCAGTGQDGEILAGKAWPVPRFVDNGNQTITDKLTGLVWTKDAGAPTVGSCTGSTTSTFYQARDYVNCLNGSNYLGYNDWRLPNINELESLRDAGNSGLMPSNPFMNMGSSSNWSSTTYADDKGMQWRGVYLDLNYSGLYGRIWPVRAGETNSLGASVISLFKTGQTKCYNDSGTETTCTGTGQDGEFQKGAAWPSPRFTDHGNGTVTDNLTGLLWLKNANCFGGKPWNDALAAAKGLASGQCGLTDGSQVGEWRLPNVTELESLRDAGRSRPALLLDHPFANVQLSDWYWSATTNTLYTNRAWSFDVAHGSLFGDTVAAEKLNAHYVWPVRSNSAFANFGILVNSGFTAHSSSVGLRLSAYDANGVAEMMISNDASFNSAIAEPYATTKQWTLSSGDGTKTVYVKFKDSNGNWSEAYSDTIDLDTTVDITPPTGTIIINSGADYTNNATVILTLSATDQNTVTQMKFKNDNSTWFDPEAYATTKQWIIPASIGTHIVYVQFKDSKGNWSQSYSDAIIYDTSTPTGSITINGNTAACASRNVTLTLSAADATTMMFSNDNIDYSTEETYATTKAWTLTSGDGQKTVYVKYKNTIGNWSYAYSDSIILDTITPTTAIINEPSQNSIGGNAQFTFASPSDASPTFQCKLDNGDWTSCSTSVSYTSLPAGSHTFSVRSVDAAGNVDPNPQAYTWNVVIDSTAPTVAITEPLNTATVVHIFEIKGTASDALSSVSKVELQITDGTYYIKENNGNFQFVPTPTWVMATLEPQQDGSVKWTVNTSSVVLVDNTTYTVKARATDGAGNVSNAVTITFKKVLIIEKAFTQLYIDLSTQTMLQNGTLSVSGKLSRLPDNGQDLSGLPIVLTITPPASSGQTSITRNTNTNTAQGHFNIDNITGFTYKGAYTIQASFTGTVLLDQAQSEAKTLLVGASAGYAVIIQGRITGNEGIASHQKTAGRVYKKLKDRGFTDDNIYFFSDDTTKTGVDASPAKTAIQTIITGGTLKNITGTNFNLTDKLNGSPAPLYIIMVDHGSVDKFHLGSDTITPAELAAWLNTLESTLNDAAKTEKRVIIIGACYSGSFISSLSKTGRIIITSAASDEESFKGPDEPDGIRSGEYFLDEFFTLLWKGKTLKQSFIEATEETRVYTRKGGSANSINKYFDNAIQHPLLDDNGDHKGNNSIAAGDTDGDTSSTLYLGTGVNYDTNSAANPADIAGVAGTTYLTSSQSSALLWLKAVNDSDVGSAWMEVRKPSMILSSTGGSNQLEITLEKVFLTLNNTTGRWETTYSGFTETGMYEIYYAVKDKDTQEMSTMKRSVVYRNTTSNNPPGVFSLLSPENDSKQKTILIFNWQNTTDPNGDPVTYNLVISADSTFSNIVYRKEEIPVPMTYIDKTAGLKDLTIYYWKIEAVDSYGARTSSTQTWSFQTDNTNGYPGIITGIIYSDLDYSKIAGASITAGSLSALSLTNGTFMLSIPEGTVTLAGTFGGYQITGADNIQVKAGDVTVVNLKATPLNASDTTPPVTTAAPAGGTYTSAVTVTLTCSDGTGTGCGVTYYALNGNPTTGSPTYSIPINITETATLKFFSKDNTGNSETVKTEVYTIEVIIPPVNDGKTIQLTRGWNFISIAVQPTYPSIETMLADISSNVRVVWGYDNKNKEWLKYKPSAMSNGLSAIEPNKGYWIYMNNPAILTVTGKDVSPTVTLSAGWNLVGYGGQSNTMNLPANYVIVWGWENGAWKVKAADTSLELHVAPLDALNKGKAYWIKVNENINWAQ